MSWDEKLFLIAIVTALVTLVATIMAPKRLAAILLPLLAFVPVLGFFMMAGPADKGASDIDAAVGLAMVIGFALIPWIILYGLAVVIGIVGRLIRRAIWPKARQPVWPAPAQPVPAATPQLPPPKGDPAASAVLFDAMHTIADRNAIPRTSLPRLGRDPDGMIPFVYADQRGYVWEQSERGVSAVYRDTKDLDEMLYWVFVDACGIAGSNHAAAVGARSEVYRETVLDHQGRLLQSINPAWFGRWQEEAGRG